MRGPDIYKKSLCDGIDHYTLKKKDFYSDLETVQLCTFQTFQLSGARDTFLHSELRHRSVSLAFLPTCQM